MIVGDKVVKVGMYVYGKFDLGVLGSVGVVVLCYSMYYKDSCMGLLVYFKGG